MKTKILLTALFVGILCLSSCQSKEERVISRINNLAERIDDDGSKFDADDWEEAVEELAEIHKDMQDCDFTASQMKEVAVADGKLSAIIAKESAKGIGREVTDALNNLGSFVSGVQEALGGDE